MGFFIDPDVMSNEQLLWAFVSYGYVLFTGAGLIGDGSELLFLIPSMANLVGSVVLPVLGAVPDGMMVLFSGMGPDAQNQVSVGVGALAGSTIMLLTATWFMAMVGGRVDIVDGQAQYKATEKLTGNVPFFSTGVTVTEKIGENAYLMLGTTLLYLVIQIPAIFAERHTDSAVEQGREENIYALAGFILCVACFCYYLYENSRKANEPNGAIEQKHIQSVIDGINEGKMTVITVLKDFWAQNSAEADGKRSLLDALSEDQRRKLTSIIKPFFAYYDKNNDKTIDYQEFCMLLKDMRVNVQKEEMQRLFQLADTDASGYMNFDEFADCIATCSSNIAKGKHTITRGIGSERTVSLAQENEDDDDSQNDEKQQQRHHHHIMRLKRSLSSSTGVGESSSWPSTNGLSNVGFFDGKNNTKNRISIAEKCTTSDDTTVNALSRNQKCNKDYMVKDDESTIQDWKRQSGDLRGRCCEKLSDECLSVISKRNTRKTWVDKRPKELGSALVQYLQTWGDQVVKAKNNGIRYQVVGCKDNNKKYRTKEACKAADEDCCFVCDKIDCKGDIPTVSTCANDEPSAFMKKFEQTKCSTSGSVSFGTKNRDCGYCPSPRDLFEQFDKKELFGISFHKKLGIAATLSSFYGGTNLHNVRSEIRIDDNTCSGPTGGLLVSPHNSGVVAFNGKKGTVFAIVDVLNSKTTDATKGVKLSGAADYLIIGGKNEGNVDITTTGGVSVVGIVNSGSVNVKGAGKILVGNTFNDGKVILEGGQGGMMNVKNRDGAEVVVKGGTWKMEDVSNAKGAKVTIDGGVITFGGAGTHNHGTVELKSGTITAKVKENTGTITIASGVKGSILICKNTGKAQGAIVSINPNDPFCALKTPDSGTNSKGKTPPKLFFCLNPAKFKKAFWKTAQEADDGKAHTCSEAVSRAKQYWEAVRFDLDSPDWKLLFQRCCDKQAAPPTGKAWKRIARIVKRKIVKAKTTVSIDFTDDKNKDKREKFEAAFIKRANATDGTFAYKKKGQSGRRHLAQGTEVTATLKFDDDKAAEDGKKAVTANDFATELGKDLKKEGVETTVTDTSASIELVDQEVVEEVLVTIAPTPSTTTAGAGSTKAGAGSTKAGAGSTTAGAGSTTAGAGSTTAGAGSTKPGAGSTTDGPNTKPILNTATGMPSLSNPIITFALLSLAAAVL